MNGELKVTALQAGKVEGRKCGALSAAKAERLRQAVCGHSHSPVVYKTPGQTQTPSHLPSPKWACTGSPRPCSWIVNVRLCAAWAEGVVLRRSRAGAPSAESRRSTKTCGLQQARAKRENGGTVFGRCHLSFLFFGARLAGRKLEDFRQNYRYL